MTYNWEGKLRTGSAGANSLSVKYDPKGDRVYKESTSGQTTTKRRYIVAAIDRLPVILLEIDPDGNDPNAAIKKTYLYANGQVIAQHIDDYYNFCFYLHDRLGSVRQVIDTNGTVRNKYVYEPFGQMFASEKQETIGNPFTFTGQYYDAEIGQYYLRARQYDPQLYRFTARDPVKGKFTEPLTLHVYLYCANDSINAIDPLGLFIWNGEWQLDTEFDAGQTEDIINAATDLVGSNFFTGPFKAFSFLGPERLGVFDMKGSGCTFSIGRSKLRDTEFGNYLAGYSTYYNYGILGEVGNRMWGHIYSLAEYRELDGPDSRYFISAGVLKAQADLGGASGLFGRLTFINAKSDLKFGLERMCNTDITSKDFDKQLEMYSMFWNSGSLR